MSGQQGGQGQVDNSTDILWIITLFFIIGGIICYNYSVALKSAFISFRYYETLILYYILKPFNLSEELGLLLTVLGNLQTAPDFLSPENAYDISVTIGTYIRYPIALLCVGLGIKYWLTNIQVKFKNKYDMRRLSDNQKVLWPQINPVLKLDLVNADVDKGPWAMAMTPIQYCKKYKLVKMLIVPPSESSISREMKFKITLIPARAERALSNQLGRPWQGIKKMPAHRRAIFAIFIARGCRDAKSATSLMAQLSVSAAAGKLDCTGADELWQKHINYKAVQEICNRHAYELTVIASLLLFAREDGVVASADYLWVKPLDRRLWYVLNTVGRQTPFVEVAGIFAHWITENALKRPLSVPQVKEALKALDIALSEMVYTPDDKEREQIINEANTAAEGEKVA